MDGTSETDSAGLGDINVYNILVSIDFTLNLGGNFLLI